MFEPHYALADSRLRCSGHWQPLVDRNSQTLSHLPRSSGCAASCVVAVML